MGNERYVKFTNTKKYIFCDHFLILMYFNHFRSNRFILKKLGSGVFFLYDVCFYDV